MRAFCLCLTALLSIPSFLSATTVIPPTFEQMVAEADVVFQGEVVDVRSQFREIGADRIIVTIVSFRVSKVLKGSALPIMELEFPGGTVGDRTFEIDGIPRFANGDRDVLFVSAKTRVLSPIVGLSYGRFRIVTESASGRSIVHRFDGAPVVSTAQIAARPQVAAGPQIGAGSAAPLALSVPMSVTDFEAAVSTEVARQAKLGRR